MQSLLSFLRGKGGPPFILRLSPTAYSFPPPQSVGSFPPFFAKTIRAPDLRATAERAQHARGELRALSCLSRPLFARLVNSPAPSPSRVASLFLILRARPLSLVGFIFSTQAVRERERSWETRALWRKAISGALNSSLSRGFPN